VERDIIELLERARSPKERIGDLKAQIGANQRGGKEFKKAIENFSMRYFKRFKEQILRYSEKMTRKMIEYIEPGIYSAEDFMEWGEDERGVKLMVKIKIGEDDIFFDFSGTDPQVNGNINAPRPVTLSAVYYVVRCLLSKNVPVNEGCYRPLKVHTPSGCLLNPEPYAAVSAGNVETSQRVVELLLRALYDVFPEDIPAESQGTMNNVTIGTERFTYYETIGGGAGASASKRGESGVQVHMTNTKNTPVEVIENNYPLRVETYKLRKGSGGEGKHPGGNGIIREIRLLKNAEVSIQSERREKPPKGVNGGGDGKTGENLRIKDGKIEELKSKVVLKMGGEECLVVKTPGGGGWGDRTL